MIYTEQHKKEALDILEAVSEKQWSTLKALAEMMSRTTTDESQKMKEDLEAVKKEQKKQQEERDQEQRRFDEWKKKRLKGFEVQDSRYDLTGGDQDILLSYLSSGKLTQRAVDSMYSIYDYGFKRGAAYQKNQARKKEKAII